MKNADLAINQRRALIGSVKTNRQKNNCFLLSLGLGMAVLSTSFFIGVVI